MFCKLLKFLIEHAPDGPVKDKLQEAYDLHCGGGVHTNDGGTGQPGGPGGGPQG